jgi:hypothetical protein
MYRCSRKARCVGQDCLLMGQEAKLQLRAIFLIKVKEDGNMDSEDRLWNLQKEVYATNHLPVLYNNRRSSW